MHAVIDRFENGSAVLLVGDEEIRLDMPRVLLPKGLREGDWLTIILEPDHTRTTQRREKIQNLLDKLKKQGGS